MVIFWSTTALSSREVSGLWVSAGPKQLLAFPAWFRTNKLQPYVILSQVSMSILWCWWHNSSQHLSSACSVHFISVTSVTCVQPCSGCSRVLCQTGGGWLERAGAASHKSLSSLRSLPPEPEPELRGPLLPTQQCQCAAVLRGAYKTSHFYYCWIHFNSDNDTDKLHLKHETEDI